MSIFEAPTNIKDENSSILKQLVSLQEQKISEIERSFILVRTNRILIRHLRNYPSFLPPSSSKVKTARRKLKRVGWAGNGGIWGKG